MATMYEEVDFANAKNREARRKRYLEDLVGDNDGAKALAAKKAKIAKTESPKYKAAKDIARGSLDANTFAILVHDEEEGGDSVEDLDASSSEDEEGADDADEATVVHGE